MDYFPEIEENVPLPKDAVEAFPEISSSEEIQMRARTIKLLSDLTGQIIAPAVGNETEAADLARQMIESPQLRPDFSRYSNETLAYLAGMVSQYNCQIVEDLAELKLYVTNRLVKEVEEAKDGKTRLQALKLLGEIDGVDAFNRRSEVTIRVKPIEEVEAELKGFIDRLDYQNAVVIEAEVADKTEKQCPSEKSREINLCPAN